MTFTRLTFLGRVLGGGDTGRGFGHGLGAMRAGDVVLFKAAGRSGRQSVQNAGLNGFRCAGRTSVLRHPIFVRSTEFAGFYIVIPQI